MNVLFNMLRIERKIKITIVTMKSVCLMTLKSQFSPQSTNVANTVSENQYHAPRLTVFCLAHLKNLPVEKVPQMIYHLKALTQSFQNL